MAYIFISYCWSWKIFGYDLTVESPNMLSQNENNNISKRLLPILEDFYLFRMIIGSISLHS